MITEEDTATARRLASRYRGEKLFDHDDAFQAGIEALLKREVPEGQVRLRTLIMKNAMSHRFVESVHPMAISRSAYRRYIKAESVPSAIRATGIRIDDLVDWDHPALDQEDPGFEQAEARVTVGAILSGLNDRDRGIAARVMAGERITGNTWRRWRTVRTELREGVDSGG